MKERKGIVRGHGRFNTSLGCPPSVRRPRAAVQLPHAKVALCFFVNVFDEDRRRRKDPENYRFEEKSKGRYELKAKNYQHEVQTTGQIIKKRCTLNY